jgi:anti-sigma factor RsiW
MRRAVGAYLDGELPSPADAGVARHLAICWECNTLAETLRLMKRSLRQRRDQTTPSVAERRVRRFAEDLARHRSSVDGGS